MPPNHFNSRPCERGDAAAAAEQQAAMEFQFTPLREGRHIKDAHSRIPPLISIHAPARGATSEGGSFSQSGTISIHAPARGATPLVQRDHPRNYISIHAPARGATLCGADHKVRQDFNSRPCERGDLGRQRVRDDAFIFQFTPLREGRQRAAPPAHCARYFNSRPCERGDSKIKQNMLCFFLQL